MIIVRRLELLLYIAHTHSKICRWPVTKISLFIEIFIVFGECQQPNCCTSNDSFFPERTETTTASIPASATAAQPTTITKIQKFLEKRRMSSNGIFTNFTFNLNINNSGGGGGTSSNGNSYNGEKCDNYVQN
jgi:hypothetical protein